MLVHGKANSLYSLLKCSQWLTEKSYGLGEETVEVSGGPGADGTEPAARGESTEKEVGQVGWVIHNPAGPLSGCFVVQDTERLLLLACEPPGCAHNVLQTLFCCGSGC